MSGTSGGDKLVSVLAHIGDRLGAAHTRVGFLEGATYPDGTPVATVAMGNEFGGTFKVPAHDVTITRNITSSGEWTEGRVRKDGSVGPGGHMFRAPGKGNFESTHHVDEYEVTIPPRPFFRQMIAAEEPNIPGYIEAALESTDMDGMAALALVGEKLADKLKDSINNFTDPANAASTIRKKGFNAPLRDTMNMERSVNHEEVDGAG